MRYEKRTGYPIYPIGFVQTRKPINRKYGQTPYTEKGRALIHQKLTGIDMSILRKLMEQQVRGSIEYADNRLSLFSAKMGKCAVTGETFTNVDDIHCHHKEPKSRGGTDEYANPTLVKQDVHKLIHATKKETIEKYLKATKLNKTQMEKLNKLRITAGYTAIELPLKL